MNEQELTGMVFNIQRYSIHDGPGIRTMIFMKGCPLECVWCANPEGQNFQPNLQYLEHKCTGCQRCAAVCANGAIERTGRGIYWSRKNCTECFRCAEVCPTGAREICGKAYTVEELVKIAERDSAYYRKSGGGVTISGGEPLWQPEFVAALLERLQKDGIQTAIETCGYYPWRNMERVLKHLNVIYMDVKLMDPLIHRRVTGKDNAMILENVRKTAAAIDPTRQNLIIRTPVIPGINDSEEEIRDIAGFVRSLEVVKRHELLPYHNYGEAKWSRTRWTGPYLLSGIKALSAEDIRPLKEIVKKVGLETNEV